MASSSNPTSCSSTVEVKLPCLVLTGSSPYVKVSPSSLRCLLIPPRDPILSHHHAVAHEGFGFPCLILSDLMLFPARFRQDAYDKVKSLVLLVVIVFLLWRIWIEDVFFKWLAMIWIAARTLMMMAKLLLSQSLIVII